MSTVFVISRILNFHLSEIFIIFLSFEIFSLTVTVTRQVSKSIFTVKILIFWIDHLKPFKYIAHSGGRFM